MKVCIRLRYDSGNLVTNLCHCFVSFVCRQFRQEGSHICTPLPRW